MTAATLGLVLVAVAAAVLLRQGGVSAGFGPLPADTSPLLPAIPEPTWGAGSGNPYPISSPCWDVWEAARAAGFTTESARTIVAIAQAESRCDPAATCDSCVIGVREYSVGVFQLNLLAHPEIAEAEARNIWTAAEWAYRLSAGGTNFRPWSTYLTGAYRRYVAVA